MTVYLAIVDEEEAFEDEGVPYRLPIRLYLNQNLFLWLQKKNCLWDKIFINT